MAAETGFLIEGTIYEVPPIDTFDMDEYQVLYDYSGLTMQDFIEGENETPEEAEARERLFNNPGFVRALMHVAYQRGNLQLKPAKVRALIGKAKVIDSFSTLSQEPEVDAVPLESTTDLEPSLPSASVDSNGLSVVSSQNDSEKQDSRSVSTGTGRSDTSSRESRVSTLGV